ncbi:MAG TPA: DUF2442 domain-containing protein [Candidatus Limnocylindrales bacterium]|nr:DUF2442 domain-containing protein [Candidatus Limnocylindrales bacterium]
MKHLTSIEALPDYRLKLRFDDGVEGVVDLSAEVGKGVFAAWQDPQHFAAVKIQHGGRSLEWPGEIDLCADALYLEITGLKPEELFPNWKPEHVHA